MTNGDKIRAMPDGELARAITKNIDCWVCPFPARKDMPCDKVLNCKTLWLDWLRQEAYSVAAVAQPSPCMEGGR